MAHDFRALFAFERSAASNTPIDVATYTQLAEAFLERVDGNNIPQNGWNIHTLINRKHEPPNNPPNDLASTPIAIQRERYALNWCRLFLGKFPNLRDRLNANAENVRILTEHRHGYVFRASTSSIGIELKMREDFLTGVANRHRHPLHDGDLVVHELVHFVSNVLRPSSRTLSEDVAVAGVEEAFCDYFALALTEEIKRDAGLNHFVNKVGAVLTYFCRELEDVTRRCEVVGNPVGHYARRDYDMLLRRYNHWATDPHYYGKQLAFAFKSLRASYSGQGVQAQQRADAFDNMLWEFFLQLSPKHEPKVVMIELVKYIGTFAQNAALRAVLTPAQWRAAFANSVRFPAPPSRRCIIDGMDL